MGEGVGLSRRTAPARYTVPSPTKLIAKMLSFQGSGKFEVAEELSAKATATCTGEGGPACTSKGLMPATALWLIPVTGNVIPVSPGADFAWRCPDNGTDIFL